MNAGIYKRTANSRADRIAARPRCQSPSSAPGRYRSFNDEHPEGLKPLLWETKNLVRAIEAAGVTLWSWNVDTDAFAVDDKAYDLWGTPRGINVQFEDLFAHIHPADRDRVRAAFNATRALIGRTKSIFGS